MTERGQTKSGHLPGVVLSSDKLELNSAGVTPLMLACYNGEVRQVRKILQTGYQTIQAVNRYHASALDYAVDNHQVHVVDILVGFGAELDALNHDGQSILHRCVLTGELQKVTTCVQIGTNLDLRNRNGETALHVAIEKHLDVIVEALIKNGCDITARNQEGFTAHECAFLSDSLGLQRALSTCPDNTGDTLVSEELLFACAAGSVTSIESIISRYGEQVVELRGIHNATPVYVACHYGQLNALRTLHRYRPNVNMTADDSNSPLISAAKGNFPEIVKYLIMEGARVNFRNVLGRTALHCAAVERSTEVVKILVDNGALVNLRSENGQTTLYLATWQNSLDIVKYLVEHGALLDAVDERGITPLLLAVSENNMEIIQYLVESGANIDQSNYDKHTPLTLAVNHNQLAVVQYLVEHGADIDSWTPEGVTIIDYAQGCGNYGVFRYLREIHDRPRRSTGRQCVIFNMSDVTAHQQHLFCMVHEGSGTRDDLKCLIQKGVDINGMDNTGRTPIIAAIVHSHLEHVAWLMHEHVNVNLADSSEYPPLIHAVLVDSLASTDLLVKCGTVPPLPHYSARDIHTQNQTEAVNPSRNQTQTIHQRLQIDQMDYTGKTALAHCAESQRKFADPIAIKLIEYGANVNIVDNNEQSILEKFAQSGKSELVELLLKNGAQLLPLCPGILIEICLSSDAKIMGHCIKHLLASNSEMCGSYVNLVLTFTAANHNWVALKTCVNEMFLSCQMGRRFEILNTETLCQMMKFFTLVMLNKICQHEDGTNLHMRISEHRILEVLQVLPDRRADPKLRCQHGQYVVCQALDTGQYETVAELISTSTLELDIKVDPHLSDLKSLWADTSELVYDSVILTLIRNPQPFVCGISRGHSDPILYIHVVESGSDQCEKYINGIPHIEMYRRELVTVPQLVTPLTSTNSMSSTDRKYSLCTQLNSVRGLRRCQMSVFKDWSTGAYWALTSADASQMSSDNDDYVQTSHIPNQVQKAHVIKSHCGLKSVNVAALLIEHIDILRKGDICLNKFVFHGKDLTLLKRKVVKRVLTQGLYEEVQGVVVDVNVSFQDQHGQFQHGAFVVSTVDRNQVFAECGQSGAAVVDTDSGIILGLVVAAQCEYLGQYNHVTFCLRLDHALMELYERYNVNIGKFRALNIDDGYV